MGIYEFKNESQKIHWPAGDSWWELSDPGYGQKRRRLIIAGPWQLEPRENCYCCTCRYDDFFGTIQTQNPFCRNHGWEGTRPCIPHQMKGDESWEYYIRTGKYLGFDEEEENERIL